MKIAAYNYRDFDEAVYFDKYAREYDVEIIPVRESPCQANAYLAEGCEGVSIITTSVDEELITLWKEAGVRHISTRTIGYDHVDIEAAKKIIAGRFYL